MQAMFPGGHEFMINLSVAFRIISTIESSTNKNKAGYTGQDGAPGVIYF